MENSSRFIVPLAAVIIGGVFYLAGVSMQTYAVRDTQKINHDNLSQISVTGEGKTYVSPDIAQLSFGVQTGRVATAKDAMAKLATAMNAVLATAKQQGIDEKDITTENLWLSPAYDYQDGRQIPRGYEANQSLSVKVRDLDKIGDILNAVTAAGANQSGGVNFTLDKPEKAQADARAQAIKQAEAKAKELAAQLGVKLGKLRGFSENGGYNPPIMMRSVKAEMSMDAGNVAPSVPVPSGQQEVVTSVTLSYDIE